MVPQSQTTASLAIKLSEIREKLNATNLETSSEEEVSAYETLSNEHKDIEKRYRLSMERDMSQVQDEKETKPETREKEALVSELRAHVYMANILDDKEITSGPEAEFNAEAGLRGANWMPWEALMPQQEERADTVSAKPADADLSTTQQNILPRLFPQSVANWAGLRMPSQGTGIPSYPIMTAGPSVAEVAVGATHDSSAGTWNFTTIMPTRVTGGYRVNIESLAVFPDMEQSLRRDLTSVFEDKFDSLFLEEMFDTVANNGLPLGAAPTAVPTYQGFLDELIDLVDGQYATSTASIRQVVGQALFRLYHKTRQSTAGDKQYPVSKEIMEMGTQYRLSKHVPAVASKIENSLIILPQSDIVAPLWQGVRFLRDAGDSEETARAGIVQMTAVALRGKARVIRPETTLRKRYQVEA